MLQKFNIFLLIMALGVIVMPKAHAETLEFPGADAVILTFYALSDKEPPYDKWVEESQEYRDATEFTRFDVKQELINNYKAQINDYKNIDTIVLRNSFSFGAYDSQRGGFPLKGVSNSTYFPFHSGGKHYSSNKDLSVMLPVQNADDFQFLEMAPDKAEALVNQLPYRSMPAHLHFKINSAGDGKREHFRKNVIYATLEKVDLYDKEENTIIRTLEAKTVTPDASSYVQKDFNPMEVDLDGLRLGMTSKEVAKWLDKNDFKLKKKYFHDMQLAHDKGYLNNKPEYPSSNLEKILAYQGSCFENAGGIGFKERLKSGDKCLRLEFSRGKEGMFGGEPSKLISMDYQKAFVKEEDGKAIMHELKEKYGAPYTINSSRIPVEAWGKGQDDNKKTYPLTAELSYFKDNEAFIHARKMGIRDIGATLVEISLRDPNAEK